MEVDCQTATFSPPRTRRSRENSSTALFQTISGNLYVKLIPLKTAAGCDELELYECKTAQFFHSSANPLLCFTIRLHDSAIDQCQFTQLISLPGTVQPIPHNAKSIKRQRLIWTRLKSVSFYGFFRYWTSGIASTRVLALRLKSHK